MGSEKMKQKKFKVLPGLFLKGFKILTAAAVLPFFACVGRGTNVAKDIPVSKVSAVIAARDEAPSLDLESILRILEELAELERAGIYQPGMGFIESGLRESAGDYAGAVFAAAKEMARAYGFGQIQFNDLLQGLKMTTTLEEGDRKEHAVYAAMALLAFFESRWNDAEKMLLDILPEFEEPDDFYIWLKLVCALEKNSDDRKSGSAYRAIRARYTQFPEYWYRGARVFSELTAADYAERCINLAPEGPFSGECRNILARFAGLTDRDGPSIRSKHEIEDCIAQAVKEANPKLLAPLIPLLSLPENQYTLYAIGALKSLSSVSMYREYFDILAGSSKGRLADRLVYISRG